MPMALDCFKTSLNAMDGRTKWPRSECHAQKRSQSFLI
jgi:hypothetical protein